MILIIILSFLVIIKVVNMIWHLSIFIGMGCTLIVMLSGFILWILITFCYIVLPDVIYIDVTFLSRSVISLTSTFIIVLSAFQFPCLLFFILHDKSDTHPSIYWFLDISLSSFSTVFVLFNCILLTGYKFFNVMNPTEVILVPSSANIVIFIRLKHIKRPWIFIWKSLAHLLKVLNETLILDCLVWCLMHISIYIWSSIITISVEGKINSMIIVTKSLHNCRLVKY